MSQAASAETFEVQKSDEEWRKVLSKEQYAVLRRHGTERAGSSPLDKEYRPGSYLCAGCDLPLFSSDTKFDSRTGWPSFWAPIEKAVATSQDRSMASVLGLNVGLIYVSAFAIGCFMAGLGGAIIVPSQAAVLGSAHWSAH